MQVKNERPMGIRRGRVAGGDKQKVGEMHFSMRDRGIEHVRLLVRWRRTPAEANGDEKNQDAEQTLHTRETPNENKRSDGGRARASLRVEGGISLRGRNQSCQSFAPSVIIYLTH